MRYRQCACVIRTECTVETSNKVSKVDTQRQCARWGDEHSTVFSGTLERLSYVSKLKRKSCVKIMKIAKCLIVDDIDEICLQRLTKAGIAVDVKTKLKEEVLIQEIKV